MLDVAQIFSSLDIREHIVLQILNLDSCLVSFTNYHSATHHSRNCGSSTDYRQSNADGLLPQSGYLPNRIPSSVAASADPRRSPRTHNSDSSSRKARHYIHLGLYQQPHPATEVETDGCRVHLALHYHHCSSMVFVLVAMVAVVVCVCGVVACLVFGT